MIAALHVDWFRAAADIAGAFACAYVGQWWGYRRGRATVYFAVAFMLDAEAVYSGADPEDVVRAAARYGTPDRQDERIAP